ncbi:MAG: outer membrane protein assembly factor BamE [Burkholderiales bacterium]|nr:outer membrane protein assembly factor BamE [Burkholderiales bacterium]
MPVALHRPTASLLTALVLLAVAGCGSLPDSRKVATTVSPYKIDVVQGNVVTREQLAVLKLGMPRAAVRDVLGTPLLSSVFHADRWDYVFTLKRQGAEPQSRKVTLFFKDDLLNRMEADELPSEAEFVSTLKSPVSIGALPPLEASAESLRKYSPASTGAAPPLPPVTTGPVNYPPLEPAGN